MAVATQLIAEVKADGADTTEAAMRAVGAASDVAARAMTGMMEANLKTIPSVADLDRQFASMRAHLATSSEQIDREQAAMLREAEAAQASARGNREAAAASTHAGSAMSGMHEHIKRASSGFLEMTPNALSFVGGMVAMNLASRAISFLSDAFKGMIQESTDAADELAQTNATIKSTHGVAGVTAQAVLDLATKFSHLTQFTDDAVQSAENVLLTFPRIGKDIFPQTTLAVLNLSQAMHQDWKQSAIEVGKALDDPIRGMTNLRRIGVEFSDAQVKVIKHLWETGHTAEAQKLILQELNKEFGNSAVAAGTTFAGKLKILSQTFDDLKQAVGDRILPILSNLLTQVGPIVIRFTDWITSGDGLSNTLAQVSDIMKPLVDACKDIYKQIQPLVQQFIAWAIKNDVAAKSLAVVKGMVLLFADTLRFLVPIIISVISEVVQFISTLVDSLQPQIQAISTFIKAHWTELAAIAKGLWGTISGVIELAWKIITGIIITGIDLLNGKWGKAWDDFKGMVSDVWESIKKIVLSGIHTVLSLLALLPGGIGDAAKKALKQLDILTGGMTNATDHIKKSAIQMQQAVVSHLQATVSAIQTQLENATSSSQRHFLQMKLDAAQQSLDLQKAVLKHMQAMADGVNTHTGKMDTNATKNAEAMKKHVLAKLMELNNDAVGHSIIPDMATKIAKVFTNLASQASSWGSSLINNFKSGLQSAWNAVVSWVNGALSWLAGQFPRSPVKEGPLKGSERWGYNFMHNIADGMRAGLPEVNAALSGLMAGSMGSMGVSHSFSGSFSGAPVAFGGGVGGGGITIVHVHPVVQADMYVDGRKFTEQVTGPHLAHSLWAQTGKRRPV